MSVEWVLLAGLLFAAGPVAAQRPTTEAAPPAGSFWALDAPTGTVTFTGPTAQPTAPALRQAEHLRAWLTSTCGPHWSELQTQVAQVHYYRGYLPGVHAGVQLQFAVLVFERPAGWRYRLFAFQVRSPTGDPKLVHWLPLHQLLHDPDFGPDVAGFQQQLRKALPGL